MKDSCLAPDISLCVGQWEWGEDIHRVSWGAQKLNIIVVESGKDFLFRETSDFKHTLGHLLIWRSWKNCSISLFLCSFLKQCSVPWVKAEGKGMFGVESRWLRCHVAENHQSWGAQECWGQWSEWIDHRNDNKDRKNFQNLKVSVARKRRAGLPRMMVLGERKC